MSLDHASKRIRFQGHSIRAWIRIYLRGASLQKNVWRRLKPIGGQPRSSLILLTRSNSTPPLKQPALLESVVRGIEYLLARCHASGYGNCYNPSQA